MKWIWKFPLIGTCFFFHSGFSQNLKFYREDLTFELKEGFFSVNGFYNFCNTGDKPVQQILFYPFPLDSLYGAVDSMSAVDINNKSMDVIVNKTTDGLFFNVALAPYGVGKYKIYYHQQVLKNKAEYILVTTQKWGIPFENAFYKLITPKALKITSTSYLQDSIRLVKDETIYYWT
jgi:hypothetical protein